MTSVAEYAKAEEMKRLILEYLTEYNVVNEEAEISSEQLGLMVDLFRHTLDEISDIDPKDRATALLGNAIGLWGVLIVKFGATVSDFENQRL